MRLLHVPNNCIVFAYVNINQMNDKFETHIYRCLLRFNPIIDFLDKSDVMQEIRIAILTCKEEESAYRVAAKQAYRLATEYGYSKKMGEDNFQQYYANPFSRNLKLS